MHLASLHLANFKNYETAELQFSEEINCFVGENGSGKTNLLDAIYYLSLSKSAFNSVDGQNMRHGEAFFGITGHFEKEGKKEKVQCSLKSGEKKTLKLNGQAYEKISEHIGVFPCILIAPNDTDIIRDGSEERRKFFDSILSQIDKLYLDELMRYNRLLKHRNALLKQFGERRYRDDDQLEPFSVELVISAKIISEKRERFLRDFEPSFQKHYQNLTDSKEKVSLRYESEVSDELFEEKFNQNVAKDIAYQRTTMGVHTDDFLFRIENHPLKKFGSQGQQKSYLIALKLAQFDLIQERLQMKPILLLDDIFDKLDDARIAKLMKMVADEAFGQLFVTDARPERTEKIFEDLRSKISIFSVLKGEVSPLL